MSHRAFTWWRRFHTPIKLKKDQYWKGYPKLLQQIEFGEFEYCHLSEEVLLEEAIYENEVIEIRSQMDRSTEDAIQEKLYDRRILKNKRVQIMMKNHLQKEQEILKDLTDKLASEFDLSIDYVREFMEDFDGTTRHLYYALRAISQEKEIPSSDDLDKYPRSFNSQPRHVLKYEHRKLKPLWKKVVKQNKIHNAHGITS